MNSSTTVALLGGAGKAGGYLTFQLLQHGYKIKTLIRNPDKYLVSHTAMQLINGDIKDPEIAALLIEGCDVVISTIGQKKDETVISSLATTNIINAMHQFGVKRYILLTDSTLDMPGDNKNEYIRQLTDYMKDTSPVIFADKQNTATILGDSDIDWTYSTRSLY